MKPPNPPVFFIDRSLGKHIVAGALRQAAAQVEVHDDHFPKDAPDTEWLEESGQRKWIVLTKDKRMRHRILEVATIAKARVRVFALTAQDLQGSEMAAIFVKALPKMSRFALGNPAPFIATVSKSGAVSMMLSAKKLRRYR